MSSEQTDWTSKKLLNWMRERFEASGVDASRVVAETLLAEAFSCSRLELHMHPNRPASGEERDRLRVQVRRILSGEPLHYVTGKAQFWHGSFAVRPCTQIPQPCTELLVSHTLGLLSSRGQTVGHGRRAVDSLSVLELGAEQDQHRPVPLTRFQKSMLRLKSILIRKSKPQRASPQIKRPTSSNLAWAAAL